MRVLDSFRNIVSGLMGTARDKTVHVEAVFNPISVAQIEALYRGNALARKIIEIPPGDMMREGRAWSLEADEIGLLDRAERQFQISAKVEQALIWARLYGGAAIILGTGDADPSLPLGTVPRGGLKYVTVLTRYQIGYREIDNDPTSARYKLPLMYTVTGASMVADVHPSRVIHIRGARGHLDDPWGDSVFETVRDALVHDGMAAQNAAHLVGEAKIDVITMADLNELTSTEAGQRKVQERFALGAQVRGIYSTLLLGDGEEFAQKQINLSGLPDILDAFAHRVCAAADIPASRLLGRQPGGLNANGDADIRNFYDRIGADQERTLRPIYDQIDSVLWPSTLGRPRPDDAWFEFRPLWQMSEKEQAEVSAIKARTVQTYFDTGIVPQEVLQVGTRHMLSEDGMFPGIEKTWDEFEAGTLEGVTLPEEEPEPEPEPELEPPATRRPEAEGDDPA